MRFARMAAMRRRRFDPQIPAWNASGDSIEPLGNREVARKGWLVFDGHLLGFIYYDEFQLYIISNQRQTEVMQGCKYRL